MPHISVVGSINIDLVVTSDRMPRKGETIIGNQFKAIPGGKGANQAVAIARLGSEVEMFGCVGDDLYAEMVINNLKNNGVIVDYLKPVSKLSTGTASIIVAENDNSIIVIPGANNSVDISYIDWIKERLLASELVLLQHEIPFDVVEYVIKLCYKNAVPVILNPAPAFYVPSKLIDMVTYVTPNEHEAMTVFNSDDIDSIMLRYPKKLIVTLGKEGAAYSDGKSIIRVPAIEAMITDTTGAGDTFSGAFAKAVSEGMDIHEAVVFAQYASGTSIEKFGAQSGMPTLKEVMDRMRRDRG